MDTQLDRQIKFEPAPLLQYIYENISVDAEVQDQIPDGFGGYKKEMKIKRILKQCSGKFQPKTMTAILGPSGSGKTTMLNLLSGRQLNRNLTLKGSIKINGKHVQTMTEYKGIVGYVMQEDLILPTFTPRETFKFITDMRLPNKTQEQKNGIVQSMIESLGLTKCAETYVGNSLIKGLSGGQKKRTSVGVQLLINPSLIFLDEPTTGLDSTTALNLIRFLNRLAQAGRTVVTTIHQPSSEIFLQFDVIMLMLDGHIVYHNRADGSMKYFNKLGLPVPVHSNPMDHYMRIMNKQGIMLSYMQNQKPFTEQQINKQFQQRINYLVASYKESEQPLIQKVHVSLTQHNNSFAPWCTQFWLIIKRSAINQLRNPLGIRAKIFQMIFYAAISIILYQKKASSLDSYFQNTTGVIFFLVLNIGFTGVFGSINVFSQQRPIFIRERLSNTYQTSSYFFGCSLAYLPLQLLLPLIMIAICYFVVHLDFSGDAFLIMIAASWLGTWMSSGYGFFLSTIFSDPEVSLSLVPIVIIPLMLVGGYFAPLTNVPEFFKLFQYISVFKYLYQTMVYSQFYKYPDGFSVDLSTGSYQYKGDILSEGHTFYFQEPFWLSMLLMGLIGLAFRILSFVGLFLISNPSPIRLESPETSKPSSQKSKKSKQLVMIDLDGKNNDTNPHQSSTIAFPKTN